MATELLALTAETIAEADLPVRVYFEPSNTGGRYDARDYLKLTVETRRPGFNKLPVYVLSYQQCDGEALDGLYLEFDAVGEEFFMSEEHARDALVERSSSPDPKLRSAPSARAQLADLVLQSFEKTLGQAGASLGSILAAQLGTQLSLDKLERRDQLFAAFVSQTSVDYDGAAAHAAYIDPDSDRSITLPVWKWLEIKTAYDALRFLDFVMMGENPSWEDVCGSTVFTSTDVQFWLNDSLSGNPSSSVGGQLASMYTVVFYTMLYDMAKLSISLQKRLSKKAAA